MESLRQDLRYALRILTGSPGATLVVVIALGLGIGANTAMFSAVDAVLLKPLPYEDPDRLVKLWTHFAGIGLPKDQNWVSGPEYVDFRDQNRSFSHIAAMSGGALSIKVGELPETVEGAYVSADFFQVLGINAQPGRTFVPGEDQPGHENVIVLGHGLWRRRFGGDRNILGQTLMVNSRPYLVAGIAPPGFQFPSETEAWAPLAFSAEDLSPRSRGNHGYQVIARIKPELSFEQARSDMQALSGRIVEQNPNYPYRQFQFYIVMNRLLDELVGDIRPALWILMGSVVLVLLIACANVANLLLARATARGREIALRTALGAARARVIRQLLTESVTLALMGSVVGLALARLILSTLIRIGSTSFPRIAASRLDARVFAFAILISVATGMLFGLAPALQASRTPHDALKEGGRASTPGAGSQRLRRVPVAGELALSLVLLAGAGLLLKSFFRLQQVDPGFRPEGVLTLRLALPEARYSKPEQIRAFFRELVGRTSRLPGVEAAGGVSALPLSGSGSSGTTTVDSRAVPPEDASPEADWRVVTPRYFEAMGIRLLRGRYFDDRDAEGTAPVAIIDETMAQIYWPGEDPVGKRLHRGGQRSSSPWMTIVGVVKHVRYQTLETQSRVQLYWPYAQNPWPYISLAARTSLDPASLAAAIQREVLKIDPDQPIAMVRTMDQLLADSLARRRFSMLLLACYAGTALLLAAVGVYGVVSYAVTQRAHEMGVRAALGATRLGILRLILGQSLLPTITGVAIGLAGSIAVTRLIAGLLFDVRPTDPVIFVIVALFLAAVAVTASLLPALRATKVDPVVVLRYE